MSIRKLDPIARERETIADLAAGSPLTYAQIREAAHAGTLTETLAGLNAHQRIAAAAVYAERLNTSISDALAVFGRMADLAGETAAQTVPVEPAISEPVRVPSYDAGATATYEVIVATPTAELRYHLHNAYASGIAYMGTVSGAEPGRPDAELMARLRELWVNLFAAAEPTVCAQPRVSSASPPGFMGACQCSPSKRPRLP
jgi:hypothetical protein